jgi:hypothetical protein
LRAERASVRPDAARLPLTEHNAPHPAGPSMKSRTFETPPVKATDAVRVARSIASINALSMSSGMVGIDATASRNPSIPSPAMRPTLTMSLESFI